MKAYRNFRMDLTEPFNVHPGVYHTPLQTFAHPPFYKINSTYSGWLHTIPAYH